MTVQTTMERLNDEFDNSVINDISYDSDFESYDKNLYEPLPWNTPIEIDIPLLIEMLPDDILATENIGYNFLHNSETSNYENHMKPNQFPQLDYNQSSSTSSTWHSVYIPTYSSRAYPSVVEYDTRYTNLHVPMSPISRNDLPHTDKISSSTRKRNYKQFDNSVYYSARYQNAFAVSNNTTNNMKPPKKCKRQPRPKLTVLPRSTGPIYTLNEYDVLSGRGGRVNAHAGNIHFRNVVAQFKSKYVDRTTRKLEKAHIAADIVHRIRQQGGRFLIEEDDYPGTWYEVGDARAIRKAGQALRDGNDDSDSYNLLKQATESNDTARNGALITSNTQHSSQLPKLTQMIV
jgi:hypothetical protein